MDDFYEISKRKIAKTNMERVYVVVTRYCLHTRREVDEEGRRGGGEEGRKGGREEGR